MKVPVPIFEGNGANSSWSAFIDIGKIGNQLFSKVFGSNQKNPDARINADQPREADGRKALSAALARDLNFLIIQVHVIHLQGGNLIQASRRIDED